MILWKSISTLLATAIISVNAQNISAARFASFCGFLKNNIYCYGGSNGTRDNQIVHMNMLSLDVSQANGISTKDLQNNWKLEYPDVAAGVNTENRQYSQYAVVDGTRLVLSGGYGGANTVTPIVDQTIAFDVESKSWNKYPNYIENSFGNRQIYWASTAEVPSKGLAFYGGFEHHINKSWTISTNQNLTATIFNDGYSRAVGYTSVTYLDITNSNNPWTTPPQTNVPGIFSSFQSSIYDPTSKKVFYFGGAYEDTLIVGYDVNHIQTWHQFSYALTFDTVSNVWGNVTLKGNAIPSMRRLHTTTLLPKDQSTVLLYGGEKEDIVSKDYCFTLDLKTLTWTQQNIQAPFIDHLRARHCAVLANNDSLFIVHGLDSTSTATSALISLNISNPSSITYLESYEAPNASSTPAERAQGTESASDRLSTGTIVGIAIGAVAAGIIATAIFFWLRKKKAERKRSETEVRSMDVDWDEIERQYEETHKGSGRYPLTHAAFSNPNSRDDSIIGTGDIKPDAAVVFNPNSRDDSVTVIGEMVHQNNVVSYPPNAIDQVYRQKPDYGTPSK